MLFLVMICKRKYIIRGNDIGSVRGSPNGTIGNFINGTIGSQWYHWPTNGTIVRANGTIGITIGKNGITNSFFLSSYTESIKF